LAFEKIKTISKSRLNIDNKPKVTLKLENSIELLAANRIPKIIKATTTKTASCGVLIGSIAEYGRIEIGTKIRPASIIFVSNSRILWSSTFQL